MTGHAIPERTQDQCTAEAINPSTGDLLQCWLSKGHQDGDGHYDAAYLLHWHAAISVIPCEHFGVAS
jgi:hypothetical protein